MYNIPFSAYFDVVDDVKVPSAGAETKHAKYDYNKQNTVGLREH